MVSFNNYQQILADFVRFKSVSTDPAYKQDISTTVTWLTNLFEDNSFSVETWQGPTTNPVIFASYLSDPDKKTILIYGHYDVQPAEQENGWDDDPFTLVEKEGKLIARGVVDNKGQVLIHILTVIEAIKEGTLEYNVKFLIEGDEETGNADLAELLLMHQEDIQSDMILISDGENVQYKPTIEAGLRGAGNCTVTLTTADNNLHSGLYGGAHPNAARELNALLNKIHNDQNEIALPWFYEDVAEISDEAITQLQRIAGSDDDVLKITGGKQLTTEPGFDFYTQVGLRPSIEVTGIKTGYTGEGYANIIPATAEARINFRYVTNQDPLRIMDAFEQWIRKSVPSYVSVDFSFTDQIGAVLLDVDTPEIKHIRTLLAKAYDEGVVVKYVGGTIPAVAFFKEITGVEPILVSLGNDDCNMHGVNENFDSGLVKKGLEFSKLFFATKT